tara:strand:- start:879 stop:1232 length:354 start_codon:yes stop_codon:yes gene_type:complete
LTYTFTEVFAFCVDTTAYSVCGVAFFGDVFIDYAVTVVILAVTDLCCGFDNGATFDQAVVTGGLSSLAITFFVGCTALTTVRVIFIDLAITVVIFAIADLGRGIDFVAARRPRPVEA